MSCGPWAARLLMACVLGATPAVAGPLGATLEGGTATPFVVSPVWDSAIIALDVGLLLGLKHIVPQAHEDGLRAELNTLDARVVEWGTHDDALRSSDLGVTLAVAFALADAGVSGKHDGWRSGAVKVTLYAESALTAAALAEVAKHAVQRPRPCTYQAERRQRPALACAPADDDAYLSFFSGHTAVSAALGATATYMAFREDDGGVRGPMTLAAGLALTGFVAAERMRAGKHFPTDVLTGFAVGTAVGVLVPHLHHVSRGPSSAAGPTVTSDGQMVTVGGVF
jgi:hypothetical protein